MTTQAAAADTPGAPPKGPPVKTTPNPTPATLPAALKVALDHLKQAATSLDALDTQLSQLGLDPSYLAAEVKDIASRVDAAIPFLPTSVQEFNPEPEAERKLRDAKRDRDDAAKKGRFARAWEELTTSTKANS